MMQLKVDAVDLGIIVGALKRDAIKSLEEVGIIKLNQQEKAEQLIHFSKNQLDLADKLGRILIERESN